MRTRHHSLDQQGFTIIELMIASLIFSIILLAIAAGVIKFTSDFYRGVNSSTTQTVASNIISTASQAFQFSSGDSAGGNSSNADTSDGTGSYICAGSKEFVYYNLGNQEQAPATSPPTGLFVFTPKNGCQDSPTSDPNWANRQDLLQPNMRLVKFSANNAGDSAVWNLEVDVAYGDAPLLCDNSKNGGQGGCQPGDDEFDEGLLASDIQNNDSIVSNLQCKPQSGSQFCSIVTLSTTVQARL